MEGVLTARGRGRPPDKNVSHNPCAAQPSATHRSGSEVEQVIAARFTGMNTGMNTRETHGSKKRR